MNKEQFLEFISFKINETLKEVEEINDIEIDFDSEDWQKLEKQILKTIVRNTLQPY